MNTGSIVDTDGPAAHSIAVHSHAAVVAAARVDGEGLANMLACCSVAARTCVVSFKGPSGIVHSVEVSADSLYEAAAIGLSMLRQDGWVDQVAPGIELDVQVRAPVTTHTVTVAQISRWCDSVTVSPEEVLKRKRVRELLTPR
jgi:hypothetical protein